MSMKDAEAAPFLMNAIMGVWLRPSLWVAVRLKLADRLAGAQRTVDELAAETSTDAAALLRLLNALSSVGIFKRLGERAFGPTAASELLRSDHPSGLADLADIALGGENYLA